MCQRVACRSCGKPTYTGCGRHIEAVLGDVPAAARCRCHEAKTKQTPAAGQGRNWLSALLGRAAGRRA